MSYGVNGYHTKKELQEAVAEKGAENVGVFGTSLFGDETGTTIADLADNVKAVIVGPDVYNDRKWYANVKTKRDGTIYVS